MSETIERVRQLIEARLHEVESEASRLRGSLEALGGRKSRPPRGRGRGSKGGKRRQKTGRRAARGQRRNEFLEAVKKAPGAKPSEIAKEIGVSANQAYALARQLVETGEVKKAGKGYKFAGGAR